MLTYYVVYGNAERVEPAGVFAVDPGSGHALMWNHRQRRWFFAPAAVARFLDDPRNLDRYEEADRATVDRVVPSLTGGVELPTEDEIVAVFRRSAEPTPRS
ncbi:hypothetical protein [Micromonospora sp. NPDC023956]|uniref:hypothetical protein n=1 Tax=Micromonospora sp. NPDC023956 TaxID=3155722 RepID=UPI00340C8F80